MKTVENDFIELVNRAINLKYEDDGYFNDSNWEEIFKLAAQNGLLAVTCDAAKANASIPEEIRKKWEAYRLSLFVRQNAQFMALMNVVDDIKKAGIDYAVFKGPAIAATYPKSSYRYSCDSDILVDVDDREEVSDIILARGYKLIPLETKEKVFAYTNEKNGHHIELHTSIYEDFTGPKIEILEKADLAGKKYRINMELNGRTFRTLGINRHFVYQMFHMIKHFIIEGASIKFFTDITLFVNKNNASIESDFFWDLMDKCGYGEFCEVFLSICVKRFGMNHEILKGRKCKIVSEPVMNALLVDFIYSGDEEKLRKKNWLLLDTMEQYLVGEKEFESNQKKESILEILFPMPDMLDNIYMYAKKKPVLLPIAWIHRMIRKILWFIFERKNEKRVTAHRIETRLDLLNSVGLVDEER